MNILVIEDEKNIADIVVFNLKQEGFKTKVAYDGEAGLAIALSDKPDLILLDVMMPKMDGFEVCRRIREVSQVPIIIMTARVEEVDSVMGFELGANDYVRKPFSFKELMCRVHANLKRSRNPETAETATADNHIVIKNLTIKPELYEVKRDGIALALTRREYDLVMYLAKRNDRVVSREELLEKVWGYEYLGDDLRIVDVNIRRLRVKLEADPDNPEYVFTKRGIGYYFLNCE